MKLNQSAKEHENDRPTFRNNKWFADNLVTCCVKSAELEPDTFKNDGSVKWGVPVVYRDENGLRQSGKWGFSSSPALDGRWDKTFGGVDEWPCHNAVLSYVVDGQPQKGYKIEFLAAPPAACPCHGPALPPAKPPASVQEAVADLNGILQEYGFQPAADEQPMQPEQASAIAKLCTLLGEQQPDLTGFTFSLAKEFLSDLTLKLMSGGVKV